MFDDSTKGKKAKKLSAGTTLSRLRPPRFAPTTSALTLSAPDERAAMRLMLELPTAAQRQAAQPIFQALRLQREEMQRLEAPRQAVQRQHQALPTFTPTQVEQAIQRQAARTAPTPSIHKPQSTADWVTVMRQQAEQAESRWMHSRENEHFKALQRQVAQRLATSYRQDARPSPVRTAEYAGHLATLHRHPISGQVAQVVMGLVPQGERPPLQRAVEEAVQREAQQRQQDEQAIQWHSLQRQLAELDAEEATPVMQRIQARRGAGNPLPEAIQRHLEQGLNHDLSKVRIHDDAEADKLAKGVNAIAFTTGTDIFFQSGKYAPNSKSGLELLAHEVTHTVQQSQGRVGAGIDPDAGLEQEARAMGRKLATAPLARSKAHQRPVRTRPTFTPTTTFQRRTANSPLQQPPLIGINKLGIIKHTDGANLRTQPNPQGSLVQPTPIPVGTKVGVISQTNDGWSKISLPSGKTGFVQTLRVTTDLPDPAVQLVRIPPGITAIEVAEKHYKSVVKPGQDLRYYVNVLKFLDQKRGTGAFQAGDKLKGGNLLWIPSPAYAQSLVGQVGSGSITGGALAQAKAAIGNSPGANIMRSVLESPTYIGEVLGDTWQTIKEHWPVILGTTIAFIGAELLVGALAAAPEPTTLTKFAAVGLQGMITAAAGAGAIAAGGAAPKAAETWLRTAWTANGNASQIKAASKAFLGMVGNIALAAASAAGVKAGVAKTGGLNQGMVTAESLIARIGSKQKYNQAMTLSGGNTKILKNLLDYGFNADDVISLLSFPGSNVKKVENILAMCKKFSVSVDDFRDFWAFNKPTEGQFKANEFKWPPNNGAIGKSLPIGLKKGTIIDRYGGEHGKFVGLAGQVEGNGALTFRPATFSERALPGKPDEGSYHVYRVLKDFDAELGDIAPWFGEPGGGKQALSTTKSIRELIDGGFLVEITGQVKK